MADSKYPGGSAVDNMTAIFDAIAHRLSHSIGSVKKAFNLSFFTFSIEYLPATLSTFTTGSFIVQNDSAFVLCKSSYIATLATDNLTPITAVTVPAPATTLLVSHENAPFLVNITDSGSGRQFSNVDTHIDNWFGSAEWPFIWSVPQVFDPNSNVTMRVQNLVATNFNLRCAFIGYKVFGDVGGFKSRKGI
jgi:hypothetical protein